MSKKVKTKVESEVNAVTEQEQIMEPMEGPRLLHEIVEAEHELCDKVAFNRHMIRRYKVENGITTVDPKIWKDALAAAEKLRNKYGAENLGPYDDFEWGMLSGKLSALRWVLGEYWDFLDT